MGGTYCRVYKLGAALRSTKLVSLLAADLPAVLTGVLEPTG